MNTTARYGQSRLKQVESFVCLPWSQATVYALSHVLRAVHRVQQRSPVAPKCQKAPALSQAAAESFQGSQS